MASESPGVLLLLREDKISVEDAAEVVLGSGQEDGLDCVQTRGLASIKNEKTLLRAAKSPRLPMKDGR